MKKMSKIAMKFMIVLGLLVSSFGVYQISANETKSTTRATNEIQLINGNFEEPALPWAEIPRGYDWVNASLVPGWSTTDSKNEIEFITKSGSISAPEGVQFVELNAHSVGELYQVIETVPGTRMRWSLQHRGRYGTDTMSVNIGAPGGTLNKTQVSSPNTKWTYHTGVYTVPAGQTQTYFGFESVSSSGGATIGNYMDDLRFATMASVEMEKHVSQSQAVYGDVLTYTLDLKNSGGTDAEVVDLTDVIPTGLEYVSGTMTANGTLQTDANDTDFMHFDAASKTVKVKGSIVKPVETYQITFQARVTALQATTISNTADLTYQDSIENLEATEEFEVTSNTVDTEIATKRSMITVKYQDTDGNMLVLDKSNQYDAGYAYNETPVTIPAHTYASVIGTPSGTLGGEDIVITFVYNRNTTSLPVVYRDMTDGSALDTDTVSGFVGDTYITHAKRFPNYILKNIPLNSTGIFVEGSNATIYYDYEPMPSSGVLVQYVDGDGNEVAPAVILNGVVGDPYQATAASVNGYLLQDVPTNETGAFTTTLQFVIYVYDREVGGNVNVLYQDEAGETLRVNAPISGFVNDSYKTIAYTIPGYTLNAIPANAHGSITNLEQTVLYVYRRAEAAPVSVSYIDTDGATVAPSETLTGLVGDGYTSVEKVVYGYRLSATPANAVGVFSDAPQTVVYVYEREDSAAVNVEYVDEAGLMVSRTMTKYGLINDGYTTSERKVYGYALIDTPTNADGVYSDQEQTVTYIYERLVGGDITVEYVDTNGDTLAESIPLTGYLYQLYTTSAAMVDGYTLVETPENAEGRFETNTQTVRYVYDRSLSANVVVKYVDEDGNAIAKEEVMNGFVDDEFKTTAITISGYELVKTPANASGIYSNQEQTVTYVYRKLLGGTTEVPTGPTGDVNTGDETNLKSMLMLGIVTSLSILLVYYRRKRRQ